ncbi:hypothetical protein PVAND_008073 [Polypedilum vanderplanki]|uniref:Uncharacterized protein n=1 Tax=Polypedilum vanderplanki TaxID=319348 RepID=A0A9J6C8C6_POLVA|nr:hypothetical protein PVAND_008073 [Polypedilum vanderplanki]
MKARFFILFISLLAAPVKISSQIININCIFVAEGPNYDCRLSGIFIGDNEAQTFNIGGVHLPQRDNTHVTRVIISSSFVPFVIREFFTTFVNLQQYHYIDSSFQTRVQNNAFQNAANLVEITIARTNGLTVYPNAFLGAVALQRLFLQQNQISEIPQNLIMANPNITAVDFSNNAIPLINEQFFRPQQQMLSINLNNNLLTRLPNRLLEGKTNLVIFNAQNNNITAIGSRFLFGLNSLTTLSLGGNDCINADWNNIGTGTTKDQVNTQLETCFNNYSPGLEWRDYRVRIRGSFRMYDEDGNLILGQRGNVILLLITSSFISAVSITCVFIVIGSNYDCIIISIFIPDNEDQYFLIGGIHQPQKTNIDVNRVLIFDSSIPFVIREFFTTFPNLQSYQFSQSSFPTRIQNNAFQGAANIISITFSGNNGLTLFPNSFIGATSLLHIQLNNNLLTDLPQNLLTGLNDLQSFSIQNNQIAMINENYFTDQQYLISIQLDNNLLTRIPNNLLANKNDLYFFTARNNRINAIGNQFLNDLHSLSILVLAGNECIDRNWEDIGSGTSIQEVNSALQLCFANYINKFDFDFLKVVVMGN